MTSNRYRITKTLFCSIILIFVIGSAKAQRSDDPPPAAPGLEMKRSDLMQGIMRLDSNIVIKKGLDTLGMERYQGVDGLNILVELIGSEDDLKIANWTFPIVNDNALFKKQVTKTLIIFYALGKKKGIDWFNENLMQIANTHATTKVYNKKLFDYMRMCEFTYDPYGKRLTVKFTSLDYQGH